MLLSFNGNNLYYHTVMKFIFLLKTMSFSVHTFIPRGSHLTIGSKKGVWVMWVTASLIGQMPGIHFKQLVMINSGKALQISKLPKIEIFTGSWFLLYLCCTFRIQPQQHSKNTVVSLLFHCTLRLYSFLYLWSERQNKYSM